ncbi:MAG: trypsin-like peptidase domain-containing protein, partial [Lachnospiraceae bacterium]|nr:trypsin-like peptidase domain-containing protein [Lachnospiraceae bacterium]
VMLDDLSAETKEAIAVASLGNSDNLRLGEPVIAIGNALGYGQSVTDGIVSAINRQITNEDGITGSFIQTNAAINPGNSGGALLNMQGQVIGINSSKIGGSAIEGMGFAIPISAAQPIIDDLSLQTTKIKVDEAKRGYLGISIDERTSNYMQMYGMPQGLFVGEVVKDGAAAKAGMQIRDIIVAFDTFKIGDYADLQEAMQYYEAGTTVPVEVMRLQNGEYTSVMLEVTLGERPKQ